jgi:hypothetical protein
MLEIQGIFPSLAIETSAAYGPPITPYARGESLPMLSTDACHVILYTVMCLTSGGIYVASLNEEL